MFMDSGWGVGRNKGGGQREGRVKTKIMNQIQKQLSSLSSWCEGVGNLTGKCWVRIYKKERD